MSNEKLRNIIESHDKQIDTTKNVLSRLSRLILMDIDVDAQTFDVMLNRYIRKLAEERGEYNTSIKTNFTSALCSPTLTWKYFERFLKVLDPRKIRVTIDLTWKDGSTTTHSMDVNFVNQDEDDE